MSRGDRREDIFRDDADDGMDCQTAAEGHQNERRDPIARGDAPVPKMTSGASSPWGQVSGFWVCVEFLGLWRGELVALQPLPRPPHRSPDAAVVQSRSPRPSLNLKNPEGVFQRNQCYGLTPRSGQMIPSSARSIRKGRTMAPRTQSPPVKSRIKRPDPRPLRAATKSARPLDKDHQPLHIDFRLQNDNQ